VKGPLTLAMNSIPPEIRQNDMRSSVGGRDGAVEVGGFIYIMIYVSNRAIEAALKRLPHCLWTIVDTMEACSCDAMDPPIRKMTRAGRGLIEIPLHSDPGRSSVTPFDVVDMDCMCCIVCFSPRPFTLTYSTSMPHCTEDMSQHGHSIILQLKKNLPALHR
jgi:hypothetical protein